MPSRLILSYAPKHFCRASASKPLNVTITKIVSLQSLFQQPDCTKCQQMVYPHLPPNVKSIETPTAQNNYSTIQKFTPDNIWTITRGLYSLQSNRDKVCFEPRGPASSPGGFAGTDVESCLIHKQWKVCAFSWIYALGGMQVSLFSKDTIICEITLEVPQRLLKIHGVNTSPRLAQLELHGCYLVEKTLPRQISLEIHRYFSSSTLKFTQIQGKGGAVACPGATDIT